jgi:tetratricopeptide (TPR) repeat protein
MKQPIFSVDFKELFGKKVDVKVGDNDKSYSLAPLNNTAPEETLGLPSSDKNVLSSVHAEAMTARTSKSKQASASIHNLNKDIANIWHTTTGRVTIAFVLLQIIFLILLCKSESFSLLGQDSSMFRNWIVAEQCFNEAKLISPNSTEANLGLAHTSFEQGKLDKAEEYAKLAIAIEPTSEAYNILGNINCSKNDAAGAFKNFELALKYDPKDPVALSSLAWANSKLGNQKLANELYAQVSSADPCLATTYHINGFQTLDEENPRFNPQLGLSYEERALGMHIEKTEPKRFWYAHLNSSSAYNLLKKPAEAKKIAEYILANCHDKDTLGWARENLEEANKNLAGK